MAIIPKRVQMTHEGVKYSIEFQVDAPVDKQWMWTIQFVRYGVTHPFRGHAKSEQQAIHKARRKIEELNERWAQ